MEKLNVLVLFGGQSSEHEVSLVSATNFVSLINLEKYNLTKVYITKNGEWFLYEGENSAIKDGNFGDKASKRAFISPDTTSGLVVDDKGKTEYIKIDVVVPMLHGANGEDGTIQGLCALAKIPCVGPDMLSSAVCMDKTFTKVMLKHLGIAQADWVTVLKRELADMDSAVKKVEDKFSYPVFIKPANAGSSVGIGKAHNREDLISCLENAAKHDKRILVEEFIDGREVECAVLGNDDPIVSVPGEIIPAKEFYDYESKYVIDSKLIIPAILSERKAQEVKETAKKAFLGLGLTGMSRVDFFVHKVTGDIYINEINTIPGFTGISMYPMLMEKSGFEGEKLADKLIELAISAFAE